MSTKTRGRPLIQFSTEEVEDRDITVHCHLGHESFRLVVKVRLSGTMVKRYAVCTECGEEQPID